MAIAVPEILETFESPRDVEGEEDVPKDEYHQTLRRLLATTPKTLGTTFRPQLSDNMIVGFFSCDRQTQTEQSDVLELKELSIVTEQLMEDSYKMRKDLNFAKEVMKAEFDRKLQSKSFEMYSRINDKCAEIEKQHLERVATVRRAFRQQLADALSSVGSLLKKTVEQRLAAEKKRQQEEIESWKVKVAAVEKLREQDAEVMKLLRQQIGDLQANTEAFTTEHAVKGTHSQKYDDDALQDEIEELRNELAQMTQAQEQLAQQLDQRDKRIDELETSFEELKKKYKSVKDMSDQLRNELNLLRSGADEHKMAGQKAVEELRIQMEKDYVEKLRATKAEVLELGKTESNHMVEGYEKRIEQFKQENRILEELLAKEKAVARAVTNTDKKVSEQAKHKEGRLTTNISRILNKYTDIDKLKEEIERINKTWEKKFAILQRSMYALKDESYLRQTLLRQSAMLHQASVSYAGDTSVPMPTRIYNHPQSFPTKKQPLPQVHKSKKPPRDDEDDDAISYTISAPSGRATTLFSADENQVLSDAEEADLPDEFRPLVVPNGSEQQPPNRSNTARSGRSQVNVIMPPT